MREIKFRAWYKPTNEMLYGVSVNELGWIYKDGRFARDNEGVMQYTGLKDKNGKEIYEGDIVKSTRFNWKELGHPKHGTNLVTVYRIYWNEERYGFWSTMKFPDGGGMSGGLGFGDDRADRTEIEVIGNIYENPELIAS